MAKNDPANNYVPKSYEDLYRYYIQGDGQGNSLCHKLLRTMMPHATDDERETLAQDVFLRIMEKEQLKVFNPEKANFGGVIFYCTRSVVGNHLDKKSRNPLTGRNAGSLTESDPEDGEFEPGVYSLDRLFAPDEKDQDASIDTERLVSRLMVWAKGLYENPAHKRDASLYPLLGLLAEGNDPKECGAALNVTPSTIHNWLGVLRDKVTQLKAE